MTSAGPGRRGAFAALALSAAVAAAAVAVTAVAACGPKAAPAGPTAGPKPHGRDATREANRAAIEGDGEGDGGDDAGSGAGSGSAARAAADDDARLAAIEKAMNALAPVANQCWAAAAAGDFHVAGKVTMLVAFDAGGRAAAKVDDDQTHSAILTDCLARVLGAYPWPAGVMAGQAIELPFAFTAPTGQNTIDRRLVPVVGGAGGGLQVQVLLDAQNSGAAAASMFEVQIDPGVALPATRALRDEVAIFLDAGRVGGAKGPLAAAAPFDVAYLAKGAVYQLGAPDGAPTHVVFVAVPGGTEDALRRGLPPDAPPGSGLEQEKPARRPPPPPTGKGPELHAAAKARRYPRAGGATTILVENAPHVASVDKLEIDAKASVPSHAHDAETELLYVLAGSGTLTVDGVDMPVGPSTVIQIPAGVTHAFVAAEAVTAIQLYAPPGPEQRFKKMK